MKVKRMVKRLFAVGAGAAMLGATAMGAMAADLGDYPDAFVSDGAFDGYFVVGENAKAIDNLAAIDIATSMKVASAGAATTTTIEGDSYQFTTGTSTLELEEDIFDITSFLDKDDLAALSGGSGTTVKGDFVYKEYLRFNTSANVRAVYELADDEAEKTGLYLKIADDQRFAEYEMDFTKSLDAEDEANSLTDLEDKTLVMLGVTYNVISAVNNTAKINLMAGSVRETLNEGDTTTYTVAGEEYEVSVTSVSTISSVNKAKFTVNGENTPALADGDTHKLESGIEIGVSDVTYQDYAGGIHAVEFYLGADKVVLEDGQEVEVNSETIDGTLVEFTTTYTNDELQIENLKVKMTSQDDYWVPASGKLSENLNLEEADLLFTRNWDFQFGGLQEETSNEVKLDSVSSEEGYKLKFTNVAGIEINMPLVYDGSSTPEGSTAVGGHFGDKNEILHINLTTPSTGSNHTKIAKDDWFILNTANSNKAESYVIQYKGRTANTTNDPVIKLNILGIGNEEVSVNKGTHSGTLSLGGSEFTLGTAWTNTANVDIGGAKNANLTVIDGNNNANTLWTQNGLKIELANQEGNAYSASNETGGSVYTGGLGHVVAEPMNLSVFISHDDSDRLDTLATGRFAHYNWTTSSDEMDLSVQLEGVTGSMLVDDDNDQLFAGYNESGVMISRDNGDSDTSKEVTMSVPETQREALVYVTSGATSTTSSAAAGDLVAVTIVDATKLDSEVNDVTAQNLIVVGGPCANTAAAALLGTSADNCAEGFKPGTSRVVFKEHANGNVAMLVAGYSGEDTRLAGRVIAHRGGELSGMEVEVKGATYSDATIGAPSAAPAPVVEEAEAPAEE